MVYCGKASQGCQSCRTRRIKCDKLRPDCSQCIRVGKKCPGYRDQLSLMFRDESSKVMQKAHAQWGVGEGPDSCSQTSNSDSGLNDPPSSKSPISLSGVHGQASPTQALPSPPASYLSAFSTTDQNSIEVSRLNSSIMPTLEEQGFQFYVNRYLVGHPDEPRNSEELKSYEWLFNPALRDVSAALGLASLSNLRNENELMTDARRRYGKALRTAGELIQSNNAPAIDLASRLVVMLAMFELVKGTELSTGSVYAHVAGGAALIRSWFPMRLACGGVRPLLQLCYSTFLTSYEVGTPLPSMFHDWVSFSRRTMLPEDQPAVTLGPLIARFIEVSSFVRFSAFRDGNSATNSMLQQLIDIDEEFGDWENSLDGLWCYKTERAPHLPPAAVFEGEYHDYHDMWVARMWNHYRWSRILLNQLILDMSSKNTVSGQQLLISAEGRRECLKTIRRLARDILASTPSHWRHPLLGDSAAIPVQQNGVAGAGAAGIPVLLFQLQVAACAHGVLPEYWNWAYSVLECIWGDMGMKQAKAIMDTLLVHRDSLKDSTSTTPATSATKGGEDASGKKHCEPENRHISSIILAS